MRIQEEARKLGEVDVTALRDYIVSRGDEVWHFECPVPALEDCTRIILIHSRDYNFDLHDVVDWELKEDFWPYVGPMAEQVCELLGKHRIAAAFIANLPAGKDILPHEDKDEFLTVPSRVHIPIRTNPAVYYQIGGVYAEDESDDKMACQIFSKQFHMREGDIWEIDNTSYHSVRNGGDTDRWHLIFNVW